MPIELWGRRYYGALNQSEQGDPATGPQGDALHAGVERGRVINRPAPVAAKTYKFRDFFGAFVARPASNRTVVTPLGYSGILPLSQQPLLSKPDPWADPTRGRP